MGMLPKDLGVATASGRRIVWTDPEFKEKLPITSNMLEHIDTDSDPENITARIIDAVRETAGFSRGEERTVSLCLSGERFARTKQADARRSRETFRFGGRAEQYPAGVDDVSHSEPFEVRVRSEPGIPRLQPWGAVNDAVMYLEARSAQW